METAKEMKANDWIVLLLGIVGTLLIPAIVILTRGAVKWTRTEDQLKNLIDDMKQLVQGEDKVHAAILGQIQADRENADKRLRFIEEYFMMKGRESS